MTPIGPRASASCAIASGTGDPGAFGGECAGGGRPEPMARAADQEPVLGKVQVHARSLHATASRGPRVTVFEPSLIVRQSTAAPPARR